MTIELEVDGEIIHEEPVDTPSELQYRIFHFKALAKSKYKKKEWYIFLRRKPVKSAGDIQKIFDEKAFISMMNSGLLMHEIASALKMSKDTFYLRRKELGLFILKRNQLDIPAAYELWKGGYSYSKIADKFKVSVATVSLHVREYRKNIENKSI